jgi:hypothetical protein
MLRALLAVNVALIAWAIGTLAWVLLIWLFPERARR